MEYPLIKILLEDITFNIMEYSLIKILLEAYLLISEIRLFPYSQTQAINLLKERKKNIFFFFAL